MPTFRLVAYEGRGGRGEGRGEERGGEGGGEGSVDVSAL